MTTYTAKFYVYELRDENGVPFYVGKGSGKRIQQHRQIAKSGRKDHRYCKIRLIWERGADFFEVIVFETDDEEKAFEEEVRLIALYGRDNLTNKTDGGDGPSNPSPEVREKIAAGRRGYKASGETRALQRALKLGKSVSEETRKKISQSTTGMKKPWASIPRTDEYKQKMSLRMTGRKMPDGFGEKISKAKMGHKVSDETRRKISETKRRKNANRNLLSSR